jgi:hypothetical protein
MTKPVCANVPHPVHDGDRVEEHEHAEEGPAVAEAGDQDVLHPALPLHLDVVAGRNVAGNARRERVQHDESCEQRTPEKSSSSSSSNSSSNTAVKLNMRTRAARRYTARKTQAQAQQKKHKLKQPQNTQQSETSAYRNISSGGP